MITIDKQLRRYFIVVTFLAVLIIFVLSNLGMRVFFNSYVQEKDQRSDQRVVQYIQDIMKTTIQNKTMMGSMPGLMQFIRGEEVGVRIYDISGTLVFDSYVSQNMHGGMARESGQGQQQGVGRGPGMGNKYMQWSDGNLNPDADLVFRTYSIKDEERTIGTVEIGRERSILSSVEDRAFFLTMNIVFILALGLSILAVFFLSKYFTGKFLKPLLLVKNNIQSISGKDKGQLKPVSSSTAEIQELVLATEELSRTIEEQDKLRKRLTSDLAHELRTPLATLQSYIEAMLDGVWEPTPLRLSFCYDELIRLTRLISDLNELSVLESDKIVLKKTVFNLSNLFNDILENYKLIFTEKNIQLSGEIERDITVEGDNDRLKQVLVNILSNANKYTSEQGMVTVKLFAEDGKTNIKIIDTGIGISPQDLPHIFERFYRGDLSRSRESGGTGIGLTIAKALVEAHQGTLEVESERGVGTTVTITLPEHKVSEQLER